MSVHNLHTILAWPDGAGLLSSLLSTMLWSGLVFLPSLRKLHRTNKRQHAELMKHHAATRAHLRRISGDKAGPDA